MKVGIVGATGLVGQRFVQLLEDHPYFEISELVASEASVGKRYKKAIENKIRRVPDKIGNKSVKSIEEDLDCRLIFSALPSKIAKNVERTLVKRGYGVLTNASTHRMDTDVPLLIPEVNPDHLELVRTQQVSEDEGFLVANPNCSTIQLALALKPIEDKFGLKKINIVTLQALSGAGYKGVGALESADNIIPFIPGEETKIEEEFGKIFGVLNKNSIDQKRLVVSASCNRVNITDGHLENVSIEVEKSASRYDLKETFKNFAPSQNNDLPTAPKFPLIYLEEKDRPQPRLELNDLDDSMSVYIGRLKEDPILDFKFIILGHNTIRGAAGASILNAELIYSKGLI